MTMSNMYELYFKSYVDADHLGDLNKSHDISKYLIPYTESEHKIYQDTLTVVKCSECNRYSELSSESVYYVRCIRKAIVMTDVIIGFDKFCQRTQIETANRLAKKYSITLDDGLIFYSPFITTECYRIQTNLVV